jgi:hypothetical protein
MSNSSQSTAKLNFWYGTLSQKVELGMTEQANHYLHFCTVEGWNVKMHVDADVLTEAQERLYPAGANIVIEVGKLDRYDKVIWANGVSPVQPLPFA